MSELHLANCMERLCYVLFLNKYNFGCCHTIVLKPLFFLLTHHVILMPSFSPPFNSILISMSVKMFLVQMLFRPRNLSFKERVHIPSPILLSVRNWNVWEGAVPIISFSAPTQTLLGHN